jgi:DNA-binding MarR family transcriptional regulator
MVQENLSDAEIADCLKALDIISLCQWDLLVFLYQHQTSLVGVDHLARLLGYAIEAVVVAMDALEAVGLVGRSRVSQGARFYQCIVPSSPPRGQAFERLLALTTHRAGRLMAARP